MCSKYPQSQTVIKGRVLLKQSNTEVSNFFSLGALYIKIKHDPCKKMTWNIFVRQENSITASSWNVRTETHQTCFVMIWFCVCFEVSGITWPGHVSDDTTAASAFDPWSPWTNLTHMYTSSHMYGQNVQEGCSTLSYTCWLIKIVDHFFWSHDKVFLHKLMVHRPTH